MAYQEHSSFGAGAAVRRPTYLRRTLLGTLAFIFVVALLGNGIAYDATENFNKVANPQAPAQMQDWRGNSAHIEPVK